jgi:hypothetical protein
LRARCIEAATLKFSTAEQLRTAIGLAKRGKPLTPSQGYGGIARSAVNVSDFKNTPRPKPGLMGNRL